MGRSTPLILSAVASLLVTSASATLDPIVIKGSKFFFNSNDTQFFIKGVAYQAGFNPSTGTTSTGGNSSTQYTDPLADETTCARDIPMLQQLGANTIRTYAIDPTQDHSKCMAMLDAAGIYVISDLGQPAQSIDRTDPQWTTDLYARYTSVVDSLASYTNVIGFFAGNEVPNNLSYTGSAAMVKAAVRDTKAYIASKNYRAMGVGYAADDDQTVRAQVQSYMNCGDSSTSIDFWGYNIYEWCGDDATYESSGYSSRVQEFSSYNVPSFFAEYGCNTGSGDSNGAAGRQFTEVAALYGTNMTPVFSGGIVYEYFEETNDYGLASAVSPSSVSTLADFNAWQTAIASVAPSGVQKGSYNPTLTAASCPPVGTNWNAASPLPPTPNTDVCDCMMAGLKCKANNVDDAAIGPLFSVIFGNAKFNGTGIVRNTTTGVYGPYSMCNGTQQLSWAMNSYYNLLNQESTACDFGGNATIVSNPSQAATCSSVIAAATSANPGTGVGSGGSGAAATTSNKKSDGAMIVGPSLGVSTAFAVGLTVVAGLSGAGMILL